MTKQEILSKIKLLLNEERFQHTLGVLKIANELANIHNLDLEKIELAALLHDIGKSIPSKEQLKFCKENKIRLNKYDKYAKGVIHSRIGWFLAKTNFGINDEDILFAIKYHTTGHPEMNIFHKIIYASDFLDPNRNLKESEDILKLIKKDFNKGILEIIKIKILYILESDNFLHPDTVHFYNKQLQIVK